MKKNISEFNIVIAGVGGQGLITLLRVLSEAAREEGYDVRTSELHGLSQRGGSVEVHLRFGKKIYSPLVKAGSADLIIALEAQEALISCRYAGTKTIFVINNFIQPIPAKSALSIEEITKILKRYSAKIFAVSASQICRQELGNEVVSGIYLLGYASHNNLLGLKPEAIIKALEKSIPPEFLELNLKAFNLPR